MKQLTLFVADSHAKICPLQEKGQVLEGNGADSGGKCIDSSKSSTRKPASSKTYQPFALEDWTQFSGHSLRSGMMRNGIVSPLVPLAHLTAGIASGLLPTPTTQEIEHPNAILTDRGRRLSKDGKNSHSLNLADHVKLIPTPTASTGGANHNSPSTVAGKRFAMNLAGWVQKWPTPTQRDGKGGYIGGRMRNGKVSMDTLDVAVQWTDNQSKTGGNLNPNWVEWLMGYPTGFTDCDS